jgi:hypothetical protein
VNKAGRHAFDICFVDHYMQCSMTGTQVIAKMRHLGVSSYLIGCSANDVKQEHMDAGRRWVVVMYSRSSKQDMFELEVFRMDYPTALSRGPFCVGRTDGYLGGRNSLQFGQIEPFQWQTFFMFYNTQ